MQNRCWEIPIGGNPLSEFSNSEVIELYIKLSEQIYQHVKPPVGLHPDVLNSCWRLPH